MELVAMIYELASCLPDDEKYGLASQMKRSAVSIPANVAEGYARSHLGDYLRHLSIARGSLAELETHMTLAVRLGLTAKDDVLPIWQIAQEVGKMLTAMIQSLHNPKLAPEKPEP